MKSTKNIIRFLSFIIYATSIFFFPNIIIVLIFFIINNLIMLINKINIKHVIIKCIQILPFIIFTFFVNWILDTFYNAVWIDLKLFLVSQITIIYSECSSIGRNSRYG